MFVGVVILTKSGKGAKKEAAKVGSSIDGDLDAGGVKAQQQQQQGSMGGAGPLQGDYSTEAANQTSG